jgi:hypothetical protein
VSDAFVICHDRKLRHFKAKDNEVLHFKGSKYSYALWAEPEGRGFITMQLVDNAWVLADKKYQPVLIECKTWAGNWKWEARGIK